MSPEPDSPAVLSMTAQQISPLERHRGGTKASQASRAAGIEMIVTDHHARLFAHELERRCASDSVEKLATVLADAQVDLNPHQIEAALFAFQSPFSKGAILADEVGLGKTIEAGLLIAQRWAEHKRRMLIIAPANLRKQWSQELADKFHLPTVILETRTFNDVIRAGQLNPFDQQAIILCSYQFAKSKEPYVRQTIWDLVVIDEAHRLRNVYKASSKIANAIKLAVAPRPKVLLTATPLQNSLLELYGLVSIIDDFAFGDLDSYKARFARLGNDGDFNALKERLKPICKRTLRRQVLEYVKFTNRHALVQEFVPSPDEQRLYDLVSAYLQRPTLYALPASQRQLVTLILRKLLASSTFAIAGTLEGMAQRLEEASRSAEIVDAPPEEIPDNWEEYDELADEWEEDDGDGTHAGATQLTPEQLVELRSEAAELREFHTLARSILKNSKGEVLLTALRRGFEAAAEARGRENAAAFHQKAVIFTESRRTQEYLFKLLEQTEFKGKVMLFNGTNTDAHSKAILQQWLQRHDGTDKITESSTANMRQALVEHFRDHASILIATEAAAEGINLQFCNLVLNYDLPWNPQRVEQRIGRCHRYGQKYDVVVVNFLNKENAADQRVYELLDQKFALFNGVFGASDEVLGAVESGVDFEKRIAAIYQKCRSGEQIQFEFDQLQRDLEAEIVAGQRDAREKLLDNFDLEVVEKVRIQANDALDRFNERLWGLTRHVLNNYADFEDNGLYSFTLHTNPFPGEPINSGPYRLGKNVVDANTYRVGHPLAQRVLALARGLATPPIEIAFNYSGGGKRIAIIEALAGQSGWLACSRLTMQSLETEDHLLLVGFTDDGSELDPSQCRRLFDLPGQPAADACPPAPVAERLATSANRQRQVLLEEQTTRNGRWFDDEIDKLEHWAEDRRATLKGDLDRLDQDLKDARKAVRLAGTLPEKLERQRAVRTLETNRDEAWRTFDQASREIDRKKDDLLDEIARRLGQTAEHVPLFTVRWRLT